MTTSSPVGANRGNSEIGKTLSRGMGAAKLIEAVVSGLVSCFTRCVCNA